MEHDFLVGRGVVPAVGVVVRDPAHSVEVDVPLGASLALAGGYGALADDADGVALAVELVSESVLQVTLDEFELAPGRVEPDGAHVADDRDDDVPEEGLALALLHLAQDLEQELCGHLGQVVELDRLELVGDDLASRQGVVTLHRLQGEVLQGGKLRQDRGDDPVDLLQREPALDLLQIHGLERPVGRLLRADHEGLVELLVGEHVPQVEPVEAVEVVLLRDGASGEATLDLVHPDARVLLDLRAQAVHLIAADAQAPQGAPGLGRAVGVAVFDEGGGHVGFTHPLEDGVCDDLTGDAQSDRAAHPPVVACAEARVDL